MKIEKLSNNNLKRGVIFGIMITLVFIVIINLLISYSKYKIEQNINLATGTINHTIPDLNALAVYVKEGDSFVKQDTIPKGYYTVSSNSYCTIPNSE